MIHCRQRNAQGWGGSSREGKGYPQFRLSVPVAAVGFAENSQERVALSVPRLLWKFDPEGAEAGPVTLFDQLPADP